MIFNGKKTRDLLALSLMAVLMTCWGAVPAQAKHWHGHGWGKSGHHHMGLEEKFYKKMKLALKNQDELGLSDAQAKALKDLKASVKKNQIEHNARVEMLTVDIRSALQERRVDVDGVNRLVDQKYEAKKAQSQGLVRGFAEFKNILNDEQYNAMKNLWKEKWKGKKKG